jgi:hypothetical protein
MRRAGGRDRWILSMEEGNVGLRYANPTYGAKFGCNVGLTFNQNSELSNKCPFMQLTGVIVGIF